MTINISKKEMIIYILYKHIEMKKYTTLQLDYETRDMLKKYCIEHDKKMAPLVASIIKEYIGKNEPNMVKPTNVLRVS